MDVTSEGWSCPPSSRCSTLWSLFLHTCSPHQAWYDILPNLFSDAVSRGQRTGSVLADPPVHNAPSATLPVSLPWPPQPPTALALAAANSPSKHFLHNARGAAESMELPRAGAASPHRQPPAASLFQVAVHDLLPQRCVKTTRPPTGRR